ncbi:hypothetical protein [Paenibacillus contaminans]|uniref:WD40 repeat domain-containing protein n=1 Tax=Paenibacillus contaminans TaxID=450362 RepID=A0A329MUH5_9BACL|nr:hypothetical protein [Paenibacillus contaminans]RAV23044.1 hypothetical protein DQG23_02250 [Paenibacillus contaminans]
MSKRWKELSAFLLTVCFLLTGCLSQARSETIIIPESGDELSTSGKSEMFDVKTIYRVLDKQTDDGIPLGWIDRSSLLGFFGEQTRSPSLERVDYPYEARLKLRNADAKAGYIALSPSGGMIASLVQTETGDNAMKLISLSDQQESIVARISNEQIRSSKFGWSNNGRYLVYIVRNGESGSIQISVYDTKEKTTKSYTVPGWKPKDTISSVHIADDALSAAIIKDSGKLSYVLYGALDVSGWTAQYEHPANRDSSVEWIHNDQIAFIGSEGSLYAYDRRNAALSVLIDQIGLFRLSPDRKVIAYLQDKDTVYAASLYGNNVMNKTQLFKGIVPSQISWSPDNGKLLLSGRKSYAEQDVPRPVAPEVISNQNMVIEFR